MTANLPLTADDANARLAAKQALRETLAAHQGDPRQAAVAQAIAHLSSLNPTPAPARTPALLEGNWRLISAPRFPQGQRRADGTYAYTLGRLAFNMFSPQQLQVVIDQVSQPVFPVAGSPQRTPDIVVAFTTLSTEFPPLQGMVRNLGVCEPGSDTALRVQFTGGTLAPAEGTDRQQWQAVFGDQGTPKRQGFRDWWQGLFLKLLFGLVPPVGMDDAGRVTFQMQRSPKGTLEILYLDEELRITKGEKGTVLVCDRLS
jgi:hypothetical protein